MSKTVNFKFRGYTQALYTAAVVGPENIVIKTPTFTLANAYPTSASLKLSGIVGGAGTAGNFSLYLKLNGSGSEYVRFYASSLKGLKNATAKALTRKASSFVTRNTSAYFNRSNKTSKTATIHFKTYDGGYSGYLENNTVYDEIEYEEGTGDFTLTLTLDVPPIFDNDPIEFDTNFADPYAELTTASVDISNLTAYYDGYITKATLTIGNQTDTLTFTESSQPVSTETLSIPLGAVGTFTPTITVTDSRGQTKTVTLEAITVKGYSAPQVIINSLERTDGSGAANDEGECAVVTATFNWTSAITDLTAPTLVAKDLDDTTVSTTTTWYTDRALQNAISDWSSVTAMPVYAFIGNSNTPPDPFDTQDSYNITITPNDEEGAGTPVTATLGSAFYTMDFLAGGHGIAFGMPSSQEGFFCNMDAYFKDGANLMRALHDFMRPVGSTYPTVDPNFNPNVTWGGTWEKLPEGYILLSGSDNGSYVVGDDTSTASGYKEYGENAHTLTVDEMPAHNHTIHSYYRETVSYSAGSAARPFTSSGSLSTTGWATADNKGGGQAHSIMQKSIAVYWWIRTA